MKWNNENLVMTGYCGREREGRIRDDTQSYSLISRDKNRGGGYWFELEIRSLNPRRDEQ